MTIWRLLPLKEPTDPLWNMAVDEVLLDGLSGGATVIASPPQADEAILRFYRWSEPSLSVGYFQDVGEAARKHASGGGLGAVRRITGGGVVEHGEDLTVSLSLPVPNRFFPTKALDSYRAIHALLIESLAADFPGLGTVASEAAFRPRSVSNCFQEPVVFDVELGGCKVIGSSQRRRRGRMLHQTAVRLPGDPGRIAYRIRQGFERKLGISFREADLSPREEEAARGLVREKYSRPAFSFKAW